MGYRIRYGETVVRTPICERKLIPHMKVIVICFLILLCIGCFTIRDKLQLNLQKEPSSTKAAFVSFASNVTAGMPTDEALIVFCREIIANAGKTHLFVH